MMSGEMRANRSQSHPRSLLVTAECDNLEMDVLYSCSPEKSKDSINVALTGGDKDGSAVVSFPLGKPMLRPYKEQGWDHREIFATYKKKLIWVGIIFAVSTSACATYAVYRLLELRLDGLESNVISSRDAWANCLPCRMLQGWDGKMLISADAANALGYFRDQESTICCSKDKLQWANILEKVITENRAKTNSGDSMTSNDTQAINHWAAHVLFEERPDAKHSNGLIHTWTSNGNHAFIRRGIQFNPESGRFTVTRDGLYQVYSHVTFQSKGGPEARNGEESTLLTILTQAVGVEMQMFGRHLMVEYLQDTKSAICQGYPVDGVIAPCHVSSIVAVLYLRRGDELFVKAAPMTFVKGDRKSTYFGLHRIGA